MDSFFVAATDRRSVRRHVRLDCEIVRERDFKLVAKRALDLSTAGMRVAALEEVMTGESLIVSFRAPGSELWIDGEASVARVVHGRRPTDHGWSFGVKFHGIEDQARAVLRRTLLKCPPTLPKRALRVDYAATVRRISGL